LPSWMKKPRFSESSEEEEQETPAMARQLTNQSEANRKPSKETEGIGERREDEVSPTSVSKKKRTTQIVLHGDDSVATTSDHEPATSPMRVVFNKLRGETWRVDQEFLVSLEDSNPVREAAVDYRRQGFDFYDSQYRILSLETCLEDIAQGRIRTIFLRPRQPSGVLGKRK
jgi:hypothetical protein